VSVDEKMVYCGHWYGRHETFHRFNNGNYARRKAERDRERQREREVEAETNDDKDRESVHVKERECACKRKRERERERERERHTHRDTERGIMYKYVEMCAIVSTRDAMACLCLHVRINCVQCYT